MVSFILYTAATKTARRGNGTLNPFAGNLPASTKAEKLAGAVLACCVLGSVALAVVAALCGL